MVIRNAWLPSCLPNTDYPLSIGLHPWLAHRLEADEALKRLKNLAENKQVFAIGETGYDALHPNGEWQVIHFRNHIAVAKSLKLPLIVHAVKALDVLWKELAGFPEPFVIHGFRGSIQTFEQLKKTGDIYVSLNASYANPTANYSEWVQALPKERVLLETDTRNLTIEEVYSAYAKLTRQTLNEVCVQQEKNFRKVFSRYR